MAKNVQNSHFSFARNFILMENMSLRNPPLLQAATLTKPQDIKKAFMAIRHFFL
jgi:hypothetical protein